MTSPRLLPAAESELALAIQWYEARRVGLGHELIAAVDSLLHSIVEHPTRFQPWAQNQRFRRAVVPRYPYVVFFQVPDVVEVVAFAHAKRQPGYWLRRLGR